MQQEVALVEKQKPEYDIVQRAAKLMKDPHTATAEDVKRLAARVMNDEKNAPQPNKVVPKPGLRPAMKSLYKKK